MSNLSVFAFEGHDVRFVGTPDEPEWVAQDVCQALDIRNYRDALSSFDDDEKGVATADTPGGSQEVLTVKEPGLYRLIFKSRKAVARRFQRWIFHEVLPSIRKTGSYTDNVEPIVSATPQPVESSQEPLHLDEVHPDLMPIRDAILLGEAMGGLSESERVTLKAMMLERVAAAMRPAQTAQVSVEPPEQPTFAEQPMRRVTTIHNPRLSISDRARVLGYRPAPGQLISIGQVAANYYRQRYGINPPKEEMLVNGHPCMVNIYHHSDLAIIDCAIQAVMER